MKNHIIPSRFQISVCVIIALALACIIYKFTVFTAWNKLVQAYNSASVTTNLLVEAPLIHPSAKTESDKVLAEQKAILLYFAKEKGLLENGEKSPAWDRIAAGLFTTLKADEEILLVQVAGNKRPPTPTTELIARLALFENDKTYTDAEGKLSPQTLSEKIASSLASYPGAIGDWHSSLLHALEPTANLQHATNLWSQVMDFLPLQVNSVNPGEVRRLLYGMTQKSEKFSALDYQTPDSATNETYLFQVARENLFALWMSQLNDAPSVRQAKLLLSIFIGPEQLAMWFLFIFALFILSVRKAGRLSVKNFERSVHCLADSFKDPMQCADDGALTRSLVDSNCNEEFANELIVSAKEAIRSTPPELSRVQDTAIDIRRKLKRTRWYVDWTAAALPMVGFMGTVRGILLAMAHSDQIVRASTELARADAVGLVAGSLGIAFTTTFVALVFGLIISFWCRAQEKEERRLIEDIESDLLKAL